jgi:hypothetical protein
LDRFPTDGPQAENYAVEVLRAAARSPLRDEQQAHAQINDALQSAKRADWEEPNSDLQNWVYSLALIYSHQTGLLPAFSNCDNETRFERFVFALPAPPRVQLTRNRLKAAIRRLNLKSNPDFSRDLDALNDRVQIPR